MRALSWIWTGSILLAALSWPIVTASKVDQGEDHPAA